MAEAAIRYAQGGVRVFPLHSIVDGHCTCGQPRKGNLCTPGKHPWIPRSALAPQLGGGGAFHGSNDVAIVTDWWRMRPGANIGARMGLCDGDHEGYVAFDIDNGEVAERLLELFRSEKPPWGYAVARSGRVGGGLHVICRTSRDQHSTKLTAGGEKLGEIIAWGSYIVVAPSLHESGRRYAFVYGDLVGWPLGVSTNPLATARKLLARAGVALAEPKRQVTARVHADGGAYGTVVAIDCPFVPHDNFLRQLLSGSMPTDDRSQALLDLGRMLWEGAAFRGYPITVEEVAGVIRRVDEAGYRKYADRRDPSKWCLDKALETKQFLEERQA
jgi:hypothetical protein